MIAISCQAFSQINFASLSLSEDSTYGYSNMNPLKMKKGNQQKSIEYSEKFLKGLITIDNHKLKYLMRYSIDDPKYNHSSVHLTDRFTGMPLNGKLGLLDEYIFLVSERMDTIRIYVDIYNKGNLFIPKGLKYVEN
jgi:hypothetical protein